MRRSPLLVCLVAALAGCDQIGRENGRVSAVPEVAKPMVSPVEIKPPRLARQPTARVTVVDPPRADAIQTDLLRQADGVVDILWVIDDSGSMANERALLVANFTRFLAELTTLQVDFHMGVTSLNMVDLGHLRGTTRVLNNLTPNLPQKFQENTTFPPSRARWEQGLRMGQLAVTPPNTTAVTGWNKDFLRDNAALAIIVVTNEDDSSFGTPEHYARAFESMKGKGNEMLVTFSVIGGTRPDGCYAPGEQALYGSKAEPAWRYAEVATRVGGVIGSICDTSFERTLVQIAQALNTLKRVFPLTLKPIVGSIHVSVILNGVSTPVPDDLVNGWQYQADTNSIVFLGTYVPPPGSTIRIDYAFSRP